MRDIDNHSREKNCRHLNSEMDFSFGREFQNLIVEGKNVF